VEQSILKSIKKALSVPESVTAFDPEIIMHINSVMTTLEQLGIGPAGGFMIEDDEATWDTFLGSDPRLNSAKTLIYMKVRLLFDPPGTSFHLDSLKNLISEAEWRLNLHHENSTMPAPAPLPIGEEV